jgi:phage-related minor tail protein
MKYIFLFILGIIIISLIYEIVYAKIYRVEGLVDPFKSIKKAIKSIIDFICYMGEIFKWASQTVTCVFAVFSPLYCPIIRIIDMIIALIGLIISSILRLLGLGIVVDGFNAGVKGLNDITNMLMGIRITDWHSWLGVDKKCYWCKFKPFPKRKKR